MFFTIWQFMKNNQLEEERRKEREEERKQRENNRKQQEEERKALAGQREEARKALARQQEEARKALADEREMNRQAWEEVLAQLCAEREQRDLLTARVLELSEQMVSRGNGNGGHSAPADAP